MEAASGAVTPARRVGEAAPEVEAVGRAVSTHPLGQVAYPLPLGHDGGARSHDATPTPASRAPTLLARDAAP